MKVVLLFPPHWTPTMPHLALPTLTAYLRAQGIEVIQRDLNLEEFDQVLTRAYLKRAVQRLRQVRQDSSRNRHTLSHISPEALHRALAAGPQLAEQVESAKSTLRSDAFFDGEASLQAFEVLGQGLEVASLPFLEA